MAYEPLTWVAGQTSVSAENLNHLEQGVKTADTNASTAVTNAATALTNAASAQSAAAAAQATANAALPVAGGTVTGNLTVAGLLTAITAFSTDDEWRWTAGNTVHFYSGDKTASEMHIPTATCYVTVTYNDHGSGTALAIGWAGDDRGKVWVSTNYSNEWSDWEEVGGSSKTAGTIVTGSGSATIPNNTVTTLCTVSLDAGTWMITGNEYDENTYSKTFRLGINTANNALLSAPTDNGATNSFGAYNTYMFKDKQVTAIVKCEATTTFYLLAHVSAGSGVSANGYIRAVRVI